MNAIFKLKTRNLTFLILVNLIALNSCKVKFVPDYNNEISGQIENLSKTVDKFYLTMLETTKANENGRSYDKFINDYVNIEVELVSLLNKNKIRPLNKNSIRICEITLEMWQKYKNEHKSDNTIIDADIKLNRKAISDLLYSMLIAEKGKEIIEKK